MVCTVSAIKTAGVAAEYYAQTDDYYRDRGHAPTAWQGKGAEALGLRGEVTPAQAEAILNGILPNGERVGGGDHRPGWDATFSAPKSVSVAAYVRGDDRLIAAHDRAVNAAIQYLEREVAATRIREEGEVRTEATGNLVAATYRHDVSREGEPDLHTHSVIANITQSADGQWRSLESRPLYRLQTDAGAVYRAALARECERLGYATERTRAGEHPSFELRQVSQAERDMWSTRSRQVEAELAKMGLSRETATAEQKQAAALATRQAKGNIGRDNLLSNWREQSRQAGHEMPALPQAQEIDAGEYRRRAEAAVRQAVEHLSERESRYTERQIVTEARKLGMGGIDDQDIRAAVADLHRRGELVETQTRQHDAITGQRLEQAGYTTREAQRIERHMLDTASRAAGAIKPAMSIEAADAAISAQVAKTGHAFNTAQVEATKALLTGTDRITLVQGYAGTAKTTSVLAVSSAALQQQGYGVIALAPTHSSAKTLGDAIGAESQTVAKFLNSRPEVSSQPRIYMVDEASMLSARDMDKLLSRTQGGRVVMVGDVKQLGSVEAGAAFRQLQTDGDLKTQVLDYIVRQRSDELRAAVYDAIRGDVQSALSKIDVRELDTRESRVGAIAADYAGMSRDDRDRTIIIAPGRDDRRQINDAVREQLAARGELGGSVTIQALDSRDMTAVESRRAGSYAVGHQVQAGRDYASLGLKRGDFARVVAVDVDCNRITLETVTGHQKEIDPSRVTKLAAFEQRDMAVAVGDKLVNRVNTQTLKNGTPLTVEKIAEGQIHVRDAAGKLHRLDAGAMHRLDHGYAQTGHESQGRTCTRVLIHAESARTNLQTQQNMYVALSRATDDARVYTDNRGALAAQIERESGQKETALAEPEPPPPALELPMPGPAIEPAPWETSEPAIDVRTPDILEIETPPPAVPEFDFDR
ncbi:TrwC protein [Thiobacillus denitrificans ATCC 25259]|uniref:TrwC protein n=1 Tax=Thiobacillus denitrificans (strain ATCC 25259 / T1) TaxID=292415 RepID=Q3SHW0_THIDA|nr:MobF family relaxase [Thiobacillus denitrificans]AAZ97773.1 TrwC protein [Thiobacillus denitrificans ATCC 25259]